MRTPRNVSIFVDIKQSFLLIIRVFTAKEIVTTDGGRFDVNIAERTRTAVYWTAETNEVRRCSWFYKGTDSRYIPYDEQVAEHLEDEYREASNTGEWQRKIPLISGETVVFHGPSVMVHFLQCQSPDGWSNASVNNEEIYGKNLSNFIIFFYHSNQPALYVHVL